MNSEKWTNIIEPKRSLFAVNLKEIYRYKDLLFLFVKRDFITVFKQTILGPLWFFIQPILTTLMFTVVFGQIAGIATDGIPRILFYLGGLSFWNFFATNLTSTSTTFIANQAIFGKVYFPRLITPLSVVISNLFKFGIQFLLFVVAFIYYFFFTDEISGSLNYYALLLPVLVLITATLGLGFGLIISSLTTKYRDLNFLIQFGVQLWMYATPIIYPLSTLSDKMKSVAILNPMTSIVESFRFGFLGSGTFSWNYLVYSFIFSIVLLFFGTLLFNKTEQNFMDTI